MADTLPDEIRQDIAIQIAERLPFKPELAPPGSVVNLGESLKVLMLPFDQIRDADGALSGRLIDTGLWHHQVYQGDQAINFARSLAPQNPLQEFHQVVEVATSLLPEAIKSTIEWIDTNMPETTDAEILSVPAFLLTALWVHGGQGDAVIIAQAADKLEGLPINTRLSGEQFLQRLENNQPVSGVGSIG